MDILSKIRNYLEQGRQLALVSVIETKGSTPQAVGAKMIVFADKSIEGTIGGGRIENEAICHAAEFIRRKNSGIKEYSLTKKEGVLCGGKMKLFFEVFKPEKKLLIVGAGHIGSALYKLASILGFSITVIDNRKEFANKKRFPQAAIKVGSPREILKKIKIDSNTFISIATHNHQFDFVSLKTVINSKAKYIGMIGSRHKVKEYMDVLLEQGVDRKILRRIHSPIGLRLGGGSPAEIALSILAQMQAVEYNIKGHLKFKKMV